MCTYLVEDGVLFSCDLFGAHAASSNIMVAGEDENLEAARRYYAEIMMPFATFVHKNVEKLKVYNVSMICPSHGQVHTDPDVIMNAYDQWATDLPKDKVVIPYISMHDSTREMVDYLVGALADRNRSRAVRPDSGGHRETGVLARGRRHSGYRHTNSSCGSTSSCSICGVPRQCLKAEVQVRHSDRILWLGRQDCWRLWLNMLSTVKPELLEPVLVKGMPLRRPWSP